jgi:phage FluMu protein Com
MQSGKCPKCDQIIGAPRLEHGPIGNQAFGPLVAGFTAVCPRCRTILGVLPDPDAIAQTVAKRLGAKGRYD